MGAYDNIYLTFLYLFKHFFCGCSAAGAAQVLHGAGEVLESLLEGEVVLVGEYCGGNKHGNLFAVGSGLEGCTYGNLGLAKAYIATD